MRGLEPDSETSTLLEQPPGQTATSSSAEYGARHDRPILVSEFLRLASRLRAGLAVLLVGSWVLNASVMVKLMKVSAEQGPLHTWRTVCGGISLAIKVGDHL
jgi:hypothetical protein